MDSSSPSPIAASAPVTNQPIGRYRWTICALLFFATTINYVDRQVFGLLAPQLQHVIGWNEIQYGYIVAAFQTAYAIGLVLMGKFIDRVGTRIGYAVTIAIWSVAAMSHALVSTVLGFAIARFALGFGESGNFPAAIKTVAEWFPRKERALATGIFNSGTNVGATIAPLVVPWIAFTIGWPWAFVFTGLFTIIWIVCWLTIYKPVHLHPRLSAAELAYIQSDPPEPTRPVGWSELFLHRQTWAYFMGKSLTDPIWWFFLFWLPKFLNSQHGLSLTQLGLPLIVIYNCAALGGILGGWIPGRFLRRGWSLNRARKTAMLICALMVTPIVMGATVQSLWGAVALICLATAGHQGWSANMFTVASDLFPKNTVASVVGVGGVGGAIGGALIATFAGFLLQLTHSYVPLFVIAGSAYLLALLIFHLLAPKMQPANLT
jgi:MFS transporter, ACS family, hexuronate transporter